MLRLIRKLLDFKNINWKSEVQYEIYRIFEYSFPFYQINKAKWWIIHRTVDKYHIIDTGLKPGYCDADWQMINGCFALLVKYVERELAWMSCFDKDEAAKIPWYMSKKRYVRKNAERLGLKNLKSTMALTNKHNDEGENIPESGLQLDHEETQGWAAKEMKELYMWWKHTRAMEHAGPYNFQNEMRLDDKHNKQLARLIRIRGYMWT